ncbi:hypothetical protein EDD42_4033 [Plantibacter flavus]|uniref:Uncharacterized protein n=1 Tax=Plantibacter flavus TaxID=150123 RepID=A0A3N2BLD7_9MICO|nr:hypothetical protein EDD42_4033 [Plantibacter flavus]
MCVLAVLLLAAWLVLMLVPEVRALVIPAEMESRLQGLLNQ